MAVSLAFINVNGVARHYKRVKVFEALRSLYKDIFLLQETHLADLLQGKTWVREWGGQTVWSPGSYRSASVTVLIHPNSSVTLSDHKTDLAEFSLSTLVGIIFPSNYSTSMPRITTGIGCISLVTFGILFP